MVEHSPCGLPDCDADIDRSKDTDLCLSKTSTWISISKCHFFCVQWFEVRGGSLLVCCWFFVVVDIGEIVDYHCLNFLFLNCSDGVIFFVYRSIFRCLLPNFNHDLFSFKTTLYLLTFPLSCSLLARIHSTKFNRSLHDIVCILLGRESSWTFLEKRLTASDRWLSGKACLTWCTKSASVL